MIQVEGYKAFHGEMCIVPKNPAFPPVKIRGDWLYRPDTGCWYGSGRSFPAEVCRIAGAGRTGGSL